MTEEVEVVLDEKEKLIRFRDIYVSKLPRAFQILKDTPPEKRKYKMVEILGSESLNHIEDYTKHYKIKKGDIVVDAGAHVGVCTQIFSKLVGENGLVLAIEPDFRALGLLTHNVADLTNVKILPYALWHKEDILPFQYMDASGGVGMGSVVYKFPYWHPTRAITLDGLIKKLNSDVSFNKSLTVRDINFIKMDIEGAEIRALEGMSETLKHVEALAVAAYHKIDDKGTKSYQGVLSMLEAKAFITRMELGLDGEIVYANRY